MKRLTLAALILLALPVAGTARKKDAPPPPPPPLPKSVDGLPIGALAPQTLAPGTCAAFLWTLGDNQALVAMIGTSPALLRYAPGGTQTDLPQVSASGDVGFGLAKSSSFKAGDAEVSIDLTVEQRPDIKQGAVIPQATLTLARAGEDVLVVPTVGLIGCR